MNPDIKEWHLDACPADRGAAPLIIMMEPATGRVEQVAVARLDGLHAFAGLTTMLVRHAPDWPSVIVTDHGRIWSTTKRNLTALGIAHRFTDRGKMTAIERAVRGLMGTLRDGGEA